MSASVWLPGSNLVGGPSTAILGDFLVGVAGQTDLMYTNISALPGTNSVFVQVDGAWLPFNEYEIKTDRVTLVTPLLGSEEVQLVGFRVSLTGVDAANVSYVDTSGQARSQASKNADWISVKDKGATGDSVTDDTALIQAAITANPGRTIYFPRGTYKLTAALVISADNTKLVGFGDASLVQHTVNTDVVLFAPTTAGTSAAFLNGVGISGINTVTQTAGSLGAGVRFLQCNGYRLSELASYNSAEGIVIQGGQFGTLEAFSIFAATGAYLGSRSALLHFRQAPIGGGLYQPCYTVTASQFIISPSKLRESCVLVSNADGVSLSDAYISNALNACVTVQAERDGSYVSSFTIDNSYLDCINTTTGTQWGLWIPADGFAASYVYHVMISDTCTIGNAQAIGVLCRKPETYDLRIAGQILNCPDWAVDVEGSTSTTDLVVTAKISTVGAGGGAIRANTLRSLSLSSTFSGVTTACLLTSGTIGHGSITGCINTSNVADWADSATWTYGVVVAGNASRYNGAQTWKNVQMLGGAYDSGHLVLGAYHIWVDSTGDLRIKSSAPSSDTDGTVVGTQS